jgi:antitoxin PrlF
MFGLISCWSNWHLPHKIPYQIERNDMLATLTSKAQITLPKDLRSLLNLQPGDKIAFTASPTGSITVSKAQQPSCASLRGLLPKPPKAHSIEEMNEAVERAVAEKHKGG